MTDEHFTDLQKGFGTVVSATQARTMTDAAERAREIACDLFGHPRFNRQPDAEQWRDALAQAIAAALREAENAAYEKAAQVAQETGSALGESAVGHCIATAIRALQDKGGE